MVGTASTLRYFRKAAPEGETNENEWHAYRDDGNTAVCGEAQLTYNVDPISDNVPQQGTLHLGCREALAVEQQPEAEAEAAAAAETEAESGETETQTIGEGDVAVVNAADLQPQPTEVGEAGPETVVAPEAEALPEGEAAPEAEQPSGEVIDGDDGTAPAVEENPQP